jgi:hypothetical protein
LESISGRRTGERKLVCRQESCTETYREVVASGLAHTSYILAALPLLQPQQLHCDTCYQGKRTVPALQNTRCWWRGFCQCDDCKLRIEHKGKCIVLFKVYHQTPGDNGDDRAILHRLLQRLFIRLVQEVFGELFESLLDTDRALWYQCSMYRQVIPGKNKQLCGE